MQHVRLAERLMIALVEVGHDAVVQPRRVERLVIEQEHRQPLVELRAQKIQLLRRNLRFFRLQADQIHALIFAGAAGNVVARCKMKLRI